jgi:hypothetical protein
MIRNINIISLTAGRLRMMILHKISTPADVGVRNPCRIKKAAGKFASGNLQSCLDRATRLGCIQLKNIKKEQLMGRQKMAIVAIATIFVSVFTSAAIAEDPFVGTWKLNPDKSKVTSAGEITTLTIDVQDEGLHFVVITTDADGKSRQGEFLRVLDGHEYPVGEIYKGVTFTSTRVNPNTISIVNRKFGKEVAIHQETVSDDGKMLTRTTTLKDFSGQDVDKSTVVYERDSSCRHGLHETVSFSRLDTNELISKTPNDACDEAQ